MLHDECIVYYIYFLFGILSKSNFLLEAFLLVIGLMVVTERVHAKYQYCVIWINWMSYFLHMTLLKMKYTSVYITSVGSSWFLEVLKHLFNGTRTVKPLWLQTDNKSDGLNITCGQHINLIGEKFIFSRQRAN